jgi:xanthine dehydrogenase YagR molybdenum-binding subunit
MTRTEVQPNRSWQAEATTMTMIGQPLNRVDGPLKVTGGASYSYEYWDAGQPLYGFIVGATIGKGRITQIDTARAERSPGVRLVMT